MDLIILLILAFFLLAIIVVVRKPQKLFVDRFMERGHDVQPLLKRKLAEIKYTNLHDVLLDDAVGLEKLEQLRKAHDGSTISFDDYNLALDEMISKYIKH